MVRFNISSLMLHALPFTLSMSLFAANTAELTVADAHFARRAQSIQSIHIAKSLYLAIVKDRYGALKERKYALGRYARLAVFEGEIAADRFNVKDSAKIFNQCIDASDYLAPKYVGPTAEYTYWRAMCIGLWAAHASKTEAFFNARRFTELKTLADEGIKRYRPTEGYGFNRILAGMYVRSKNLAILNLYQPETAFALTNESISHGCDNYMTHILRAEAMIALGCLEEAKISLLAAIAELKEKIAKDEVPFELIAENDVFLVKMIEMLERISRS